MKKFALVMGLVLAMGAGFMFTDTYAQSDPWWHPLNPQGGSHGVTYGTNLPTAANTGYPPTDGLIAVQITTGGVPTLNMYDQSNLAWVTFGTLPSGGLTDDTIPVWDATANAFEDSLLTDDATNITLTTGQLLAPNGTAALPSFSFTNDADVGLYRAGANNIGLSVGGVLVMDWEDTNAAGAGADLVTISSTLGIMDGTDTVRGLFIDLVNAAHTGAATVVVGMDIDGIVEDVSTLEYGVRVGSGWDFSLYAAGPMSFGSSGGLYTFGNAAGAQFLAIDGNAAAGASHDGFDLEVAAGVMDGTDTTRGIFVDLTNANHTGAGNLVYGIAVDNITEDADAFESAATLGSGFDAHITMVERGGAFADNPPAGAVAIFLDDNADWSGGGGNDCALVAQTSAGATVVIATVVLNGVCP